MSDAYSDRIVRGLVDKSNELEKQNAQWYHTVRIYLEAVDDADANKANECLTVMRRLTKER